MDLDAHRPLCNIIRGMEPAPRPSRPGNLDPVEVALVHSLVGRTIVRAAWFDRNPHDEWAGHDEAYLWLDDGRIVNFGSVGHDAWSATVEEISPADLHPLALVAGHVVP